ncbi:MAG: T9SS type A sorting domain-containing protein [Saprospiraceae bacterium]|nr:T9SS type A sorting domain-containing protein [Saprospiraceae bacterium]
MYKNCAKCHNPNGVAPFSLLTFDVAYRNREGIKNAVVTRNMPPWSPDPNYRHFADERVLSNEDIKAIADWVNAGAPQGDPTKAPIPPNFSSGSEIKSPDLVLKIPTYTVNTTSDLYRCFVLPTNVPQDRYITEIEVIPGNRKVVHHVLAFQDATNRPAQFDAADPEPGYTNYGGTGSNASELVTGWVPGQQPIKFPSGMGIKLTRNTNFVLQIHYPGGIENQKDSTKIIIKFAPAGGSYRELYNRPVLAHASPILTNGPLFIPANQTRTFIEKVIVPTDGSLLSVAPHMHLIGRRIKNYGLLPSGDTLKLINVPDWDFNWQGAYGFKKIIKVPAGTVLVSEAFYDNTKNNPYNPNNPPKDVALGEGTADEMMLTYLTFMAYKSGDENIVLDTSAIINTVFEPQKRAQLKMSCFPNPSKNGATLSFQLVEATFGNVDIFDLKGIAVKNVVKAERFLAGENQVTIPTADLPTGIYLVRFSSEKMYGVERLVRVE